MKTKYNINQNYFDIIDSEDKAYWIGFIYADGYLNKNSNTFGIELNIEDIEHLKKFNSHIESNREIKVYNKNSTFGPQTTCRWTCANNKIYSDLIKHGITSTKSYNGDIPTIDDDKYIKDMIRGIFDGDGSITYRSGKNGYLTASIGICGTKEVLEYIEEFSGFKWSWCQRHPDRDVNNYQIHTGKQNNIINFLNLIYSDSNVYLDRKYEKCINYLNSREYALDNDISRHNYNTIQSNNKSGTTGVSWSKSNSKWNATICVNKHKINLGYFKDINDAIKARKDAEKKYLNKHWIKEDKSDEI